MASHLISITGLQNLPNLQNFNADYNAMQTMDFSGLTNLTYIDISDCDELGSTGVKSIDVTGCTALTDIRIDDNDFSAGFPDFSTCTSLEYIDFDGCNLQGSLDLRNIPTLKGFDASSNTNLTSIIISSAQPLGNGMSINLSNCSSLTQTVLDNILQQLSSGSVSGGYISFSSTVSPSLNRGVPALRNLVDDKGWNFNSDNYSQQLLNVTYGYATSGEACTALTNNTTGDPRYVYTGTTIQIGNRIFDDNNLIYPMIDGFFGNFDDGKWYQVSGSNGVIVASGSCV